VTFPLHPSLPPFLSRYLFMFDLCFVSVTRLLLLLASCSRPGFLLMWREEDRWMKDIPHTVSR
jgi:hypothetical protein